MKRAVATVLVVLSLLGATACTKNNREEFCNKHPNNAKCR